MRLAFWRKGGRGPVEQAAAIDQNSSDVAAGAGGAPREAPLAAPRDLRGSLAILRYRPWQIAAPTLVALLLSLATVSLITPRYQSEIRLWTDGGSARVDGRSADAETAAQSIELVQSPDLARDVIAETKLMERPEFDPVRSRPSALRSLASLVGIARDPLANTPEQRVLAAYFDRLTVRTEQAGRVLVVAFQSSDRDLAALVANAIGERYLVRLQTLRQQQASLEAHRLSGALDKQRGQLAAAEARVAQLRTASEVAAANSDNIPATPADLTAALDHARAQKSETEAKARLIQDALQAGRPTELVAALEAEPIRRLAERRTLLRAELTTQSLTLLDGHPRIKDLKAQLAELDRQIRSEAVRQAQALERDAQLAAERIERLTGTLAQLTSQPSSSNEADQSQFSAAQRDVEAQRAQLAADQAAYRAAVQRATPDTMAADLRIIAPATTPTAPAYPKKLPIVVLATLSTLLLSAGVALVRRRPQPEVAATSEQAEDSSAAEGVGAVEAAAIAPIVEPPAEPAMPPQADTIAAPACVSEPAAALPSPHPELAAAVSDLAVLAAELREAGARKLTLLGPGPQSRTTMTALTLARLLSRSAKVVLIDLAPSSLALRAISTDPGAPGLAELLLKQASFGDIINRDRFSQLHLVTTGHGGADRALLRSPELNLVLDALLRVYDHVLLDASAATDLSAELLSAQAHAIVLPDPDMTAHEQAQRRAQLMAVGFLDVTMLGSPPPLAVPAAA